MEESLKINGKAILYWTAYALTFGFLVIAMYAILLGIWVSFIMAAKWALQ